VYLNICSWCPDDKTRLRYAPAYGAETKAGVDLSKTKEVPEVDYWYSAPMSEKSKINDKAG
jgi:hypothetical protein